MPPSPSTAPASSWPASGTCSSVKATRRQPERGQHQRSSVFLWTGIGSQLGLTLHRPNGLDISVGLGTDTEQRNVDPVTGEETVELASAAGLFIDRNESLLATVHLTEVRHRLLRVNVYPGVLPGFARHFGAWAILSRDLKLSLGISHQWLGAGLGFGR